jgi:hypothetical protein
LDAYEPVAASPIPALGQPPELVGQQRRVGGEHDDARTILVTWASGP